MHNLSKRKNIRLKDYNYSSNGYYFVTICTLNNKPYIYEYENIINEILLSLPQRFQGLSIDYYVLMATHVHIIFVFDSVKVMLGEVVRVFKSLVTKQTAKKDFWQRNYYEHVIRNKKALKKIREYIQNNPLVTKLEFKKFYEWV